MVGFVGEGGGGQKEGEAPAAQTVVAGGGGTRGPSARSRHRMFTDGEVECRVEYTQTRKQKRMACTHKNAC